MDDCGRLPGMPSEPKRFQISGGPNAPYKVLLDGHDISHLLTDVNIHAGRWGTEVKLQLHSSAVEADLHVTDVEIVAL